jgi:hypothetical protein
MNNNHEKRICKKCSVEFTLDQDDFSFYKKMKVPTPNVCPDCRFKMRGMWRNEMSLYSGRKCGLCQKNIISMYNPKLPYVVFCNECYKSDKWDVFSYMKDYDFNKSFFEQFKELLIAVPKAETHLSLNSGPNINSDYANQAGGLKNCYLVFNGGPGEEMMYSRGVRDCHEIGDCYFGINLEDCYECVNVSDSNHVFFGKNIFNSFNSDFVLNCRGINDCFGCVNLHNKSYHFFNEKLSQEEYKKRIDKIIGSYSKMDEMNKKFNKFSKTLPYRANSNFKAINSNGDYLYECKEVKNSFEVASAENCKYLFSTKDIKDSYDNTGFGFKSEMLLNCVAVGYSSNVIGCYTVENSQNIFYSFQIRNCHDCIGCDGLRNAEYCIFNKQYSKDDYENLKNHIIKELTELGIHGLMMPPELAPFAYNETIAQDNMPLIKEEALAQGFRWEDDIQMTTGKETLQPEEIPDHIKDVKNSITKEILKCVNCERNYKITEQELLFYRKMVLPIPHKCFFCRHRDRINRRGPFKFFIRKCDNCGKDTNTNLTKEVAPIMYCESCYQQEVI